MPHFSDGKKPRLCGARQSGNQPAVAAIDDQSGNGRPSSRESGWRELDIPFGDIGYIALYRHVAEEGRVQILAFRRQREGEY